MTNYQMAKHQGLIGPRTYNDLDGFISVAKVAGMTIISEKATLKGLPNDIFEAEIETPRGTLHIVCGANGTARLDKPNGTHKWIYEKSPAQLGYILRQTLAYYR